MQYQIRKAIAFVLAAAMLLVIPVFGAQAETAFTSQTYDKDGMYLITLPDHKIAQEFVPDFEELGSVKAFLDMNLDTSVSEQNIVTLSICADLNDTPLYTEDFTFTSPSTGWTEFKLAQPVALTPGTRYSLVLGSSQRAVWYGKLNPGITLDDCCVMNYDTARPELWTREVNQVAFVVLPTPASYDEVSAKIAALPAPDSLTLSDESAVAAARRDYDALNDEDKAQVSNLSILTAAEAKIAELKANTFTKQNDSSTPLFAIKPDVPAGQEFVPDFANLTKVRMYLQADEACDITLKIYSGLNTDSEKELYSETYAVASKTDWFDFVLAKPLLLNENQKYEIVLTASIKAVIFGASGTTETAGCCAINGENGWQRFTNYQTAFQTEGVPLEEYQRLIRRIDRLPAPITLECESEITALRAAFNAYPADIQAKITNIDALNAAEEALAMLKLQAKADELIAKINTLPAADSITLDDEADIAALRAEYLALPEEWQNQITNLATLEAAEQKIAELKAAENSYQSIIRRIDALPKQISVLDQTAVNSLWEAYQALSAEDQAKVTNSAKLIDAKETVDGYFEYPQSPDGDDTFTYQTDSSTPLYLLTDPNRSGQEFMPDFTLLNTVLVYLDADAGQTITLTVGTNTITDEQILYTEDFDITTAVSGWLELKLSTPVALTAGDIYAFTLTSDGRAVWLGKTETVSDPGMGCCALNYDVPAYGGWVRASHSTAFQVLGTEMEDYEKLIAKIDQLPAEITLKNASAIAKLREDYEALSPEDQAKVTNLSKLEAAEEVIKRLNGEEKQKKVQAAIDAIQGIPEEVTPKSYEPIHSAGLLVEELVGIYGNDILESIINYDDLLDARKKYNDFIRTFRYGDVNGDGSINPTDALIVLQHTVDIIQLTGNAFYSADVNADDQANATDALHILQYTVELRKEFDAKPEVERLVSEKNQALFQATYQSLLDRTHENGYASTSITGAYPGMFVRDTSIQIMSHVACGDFDQALNILEYTLSYHEIYDYDYALHVMADSGKPISDKIQADTTFFLLHAWSLFAQQAPDTEENRNFIKAYEEKVKTFANYFFDNGYYNEELGLLRNPSLEHSRDGSYFNAYDLLTNVYASQALHELAALFEKSDAQNAAKWASYSESIAKGIHKNLVAEVDGKTIYAEMRSMDKIIASTNQLVEDDQFYIGFSWVNMAPAGAGWYAIDDEVMDNTYQAYLKYGSITYYKKYQMLEVVTTFHSPEDYRVTGGHVIGKGLAWELMYCYDTGRYERAAELIRFIEENSVDMYRETWGYTGGGSDTANQEHASWMIYANQSVCNYASSHQ